jgi:hypothetical protein
MDTDHLATALMACATGIYTTEAGVALLIANRTFLHRDDFTRRFIEYGTSGGTPMAAIDWDAATAALASGGFPAPAANGASSNCRPASPPAHPSASATPSPASTTTTPPCYSPRSGTQPENDPTTADTDNRL